MIRQLASIVEIVDGFEAAVSFYRDALDLIVAEAVRELRGRDHRWRAAL